jgi:major vault protein
MQAETHAIQASGASKAEAKAVAEAMLIDASNAVTQAQLRAEARKIQFEAEEFAKRSAQELEIAHTEAMDSLELELKKEMATITVRKFSSAVKSLSPQTITAMARAGPEMQARLLKGLGLQGYLMTDGNSPINLFNAAQSLTGGGTSV